MTNLQGSSKSVKTDFFYREICRNFSDSFDLISRVDNDFDNFIDVCRMLKQGVENGGNPLTNKHILFETFN